MNSNKAKAVVIWLTGLSVSGKTTLAQRLKSDLLSLGIKNVEMLDGEDVRKRIKNFGYTPKDRDFVFFQKVKLALEAFKEGNIVIVTGVTHRRKSREEIRSIFNQFIEVYLNCSPEICAKRDYKGNYRKAYAGEMENFVGITEPYEVSNSPELVLDTENNSVGECGRKLLEYTLFFLNDNSQIGGE